MILLNEDEFKVIMKVNEFRKGLWDSYINYIDPRRQLDIKTKELMRSAFLSGSMLTMNAFYVGQEEDKEKKGEMLKGIEKAINDRDKKMK